MITNSKTIIFFIKNLVLLFFKCYIKKFKCMHYTIFKCIMRISVRHTMQYHTHIIYLQATTLQHWKFCDYCHTQNFIWNIKNAYYGIGMHMPCILTHIMQTQQVLVISLQIPRQKQYRSTYQSEIDTLHTT